MGIIKSKVRGWIGEKATQAGIFLSLHRKVYDFHEFIIPVGVLAKVLMLLSEVAMIGSLKADKSLNTKALLESLKKRHGGN